MNFIIHIRLLFHSFVGLGPLLIWALVHLFMSNSWRMTLGRHISYTTLVHPTRGEWDLVRYICVQLWSGQFVINNTWSFTFVYNFDLTNSWWMTHDLIYSCTSPNLDLSITDDSDVTISHMIHQKWILQLLIRSTKCASNALAPKPLPVHNRMYIYM